MHIQSTHTHTGASLSGSSTQWQCSQDTNSGRDSEPHVCGCPAGLGPDDIPPPPVVCSIADCAGTRLPLLLNGVLHLCRVCSDGADDSN